MRTKLAWTVAGLVLVFLLLQLIPVELSNPPAHGALAADPQVMGVLRRACYDCHSNETVWPWYSHVAPVSWLVSRDVLEGREVLNLSTWQGYSSGAKRELLEEIWEESAEGEMPLKGYTLLHPEARLSQADLSLLKGWVQAESAGAVAGSVSTDGSQHRRRRGREGEEDDDD